MEPVFFKNATEWRQWLKAHHTSETELWLGYYKVKSGKLNYTWSESVDEALCYGWIDGIRRSIDEASYMIRFTPRRPTSFWSDVNIEKIKVLTEKGLMRPAGIKAWENRKASKSRVYSFEQKSLELSAEYIKTFQNNQKAWDFFNNKLAPSYKKNSIHWVMTAKRSATQLKRLNILIESSAEGLKIPLLRREK